MKKIYFLFLLLSFSILYGCKTQVKGGGSSNDTTKKDSTLKKLVIKQGSETLEEFNKPVENKVSAQLKKVVDETNSIIIEAVPEEDDAQVFFDGESENKKTKTYTHFVKKISIEVKQGDSSTNYEIELKKISPPAPSGYTIQCNVIDSMGGSNVASVEIKAFEKDGSNVVETKTTDDDGNAYFTLPAEKYYNFVLAKKGMAASRVESVYIREDEKEFLPIVMRKWAVGTKKIAPEIEVIEAGEAASYSPISDVYEMDFSTLTSNSRMYITVKSKSGEIIPEKITDSQMFGFLANIDSPVTMESTGVIFPSRVQNSQGETIEIDANGVVTQEFALYPDQLSCNNGEHVLYLIIYDMAGNRLERHVPLNVKNSQFQEDDTNKNSIDYFTAESKRYYRSLDTFGMPEEAGSLTSNTVEFLLKLRSRTTIGRVDVLRRPYQEDNIKEGWEVVSTRCYKGAFSGDRSGYVYIQDDSGSLKEGATYQYKLQVYTKQGRVTSNVATLRIMEAFNIKLTSPKHREVLQKNAIKDQDFSFELSNTSLWDKEKADYFLFDILVVKDEVGSSGSSPQAGVCFAAKMKYDFRKNGNDALYIGQLSSSGSPSSPSISWKKYKFLTSSADNIDDLVKYNNGAVTITHKFMAERRFSLGSGALSSTINEAGMYYWDIQDFGLDPLALSHNGYLDDRGAAFVKEYPYLDANTGNEINEKSTSISLCNLNGVGGAVNGRSLFIVR